MNVNVLSRTLSNSVARTPAIRFRFGVARDQKASPSSGGAPSTPTSAGTEPIYDFQIPHKWRRRPISEEEIAYINRGGPE